MGCKGMSEALLAARKILGSGKNLAKAIGVRPDVLNAWITRDVRVAMEHAIGIELATQGAVRWAAVSPHLNRLSDFVVIHHIHFQATLISLSKLTALNPAIYTTQAVRKLAQDIQQQELQRPIAVDTDHHIIFGTKRLQAYHYLGKKKILSWQLSLPDLLQRTYSPMRIVQLFQVSERIAIGLALEKLVGERRGRKCRFVKKGPFEQDKRTNEMISEKLGFGSRERYTQAKKVYLQGIPDLISRMDAEDLPISTAAAIAKLPVEQQATVLKATPSSIRQWVRSKSLSSLIHSVGDFVL
jgi:DNA-binding transcriptional regulator YdaS (Cro superfamily)